MATMFERATPRHLWIAGGLALLWNALGAFDYTMSHLGGADYMRQAGMDEASIGFVLGFPLWAVAGWALGVWGGVAGSVLLLMRSRWAVWAFAASLMGVLLMALYQYSQTLPPAFASPFAVAFDLAIKLVAALLLWYAWRQRENGVLR